MNYNTQSIATLQSKRKVTTCEHVYHRHNYDNGYNVTENLADLHVRCSQVVLISKMLTEITL